MCEKTHDRHALDASVCRRVGGAHRIGVIVPERVEGEHGRPALNMNRLELEVVDSDRLPCASLTMFRVARSAIHT